MDFEAITTQEAFDARVQELYGDVAGMQTQITSLTGERDAHAATITQLQGEINGYKKAEMKQRIAREKGIPAEMASRLSGETEQEIKADADAMAQMIRTIKGPAPMHDPEPNANSENADMRAMLSQLRGE